MPYKEIRIGNEVFVSRISPEAVDEWLDIRERNRNIGYPDRPPDVDTPLQRAWISHPNETNQFTIAALGVEDVFPIYSFAGDIPIAEIKLLVTYRTKSDEYVFRRVARDNEGNTLGDKSYVCADNDHISEVFDNELEKVSQFAGENPFISTYFDFEEMTRETKVAIKELEEYYGPQKGGLLN
jgi:hypothetical protein